MPIHRYILLSIKLFSTMLFHIELKILILPPPLTWVHVALPNAPLHRVVALGSLEALRTKKLNALDIQMTYLVRKILPRNHVFVYIYE